MVHADVHVDQVGEICLLKKRGHVREEVIRVAVTNLRNDEDMFHALCQRNVEQTKRLLELRPGLDNPDQVVDADEPEVRGNRHCKEIWSEQRHWKRRASTRAQSGYVHAAKVDERAVILQKGLDGSIAPVSVQGPSRVRERSPVMGMFISGASTIVSCRRDPNCLQPREASGNFPQKKAVKGASAGGKS